MCTCSLCTRSSLSSLSLSAWTNRALSSCSWPSALLRPLSLSMRPAWRLLSSDVKFCLSSSSIDLAFSRDWRAWEWMVTCDQSMFICACFLFFKCTLVSLTLLLLSSCSWRPSMAELCLILNSDSCASWRRVSSSTHLWRSCNSASRRDLCRHSTEVKWVFCFLLAKNPFCYF